MYDHSDWNNQSNKWINLRQGFIERFSLKHQEIILTLVYDILRPIMGLSSL